jgi:peptidoglycan-N-acetylglucosamine deacetylase
MLRLAIALFLILTFPVHAQHTFHWPNKKKAAIILTYDDAIASQLHIALPQLNKYKLKGTFFLDARLSEEDMVKWRSASKAGHELGNHTLYHPCSKLTLKLNPRFASENYDVYSILREIGAMNKILFGIDGKKTRTYAFPCTETSVGGVEYTDSLRLSGLVKSIITDFQNINYYKVPSWGIADNTDEAALIDFVKRVQQKQGLGVLMFHGVGGDYLKVSAQAHEKLLQYLSEHADEIWIGTFQQVMDYIKAQAENN